MYYLSPEAKEVEKKVLAAMDEANTLSPEDHIKLLDELAKECQTRSWVQQVVLKNKS